MPFEFAPQALDGLVLVRPRVFEDDRGRFLETYQQADFAAAGLGAVFVQDNASVSRRGVLRGIHYQLPPHAQAKLVGVAYGAIWVVGVDLRQDAPSFGRWQGVTLDAEDPALLYLPPGFGHGFVVTSDTARVHYKVSAPYAPAYERGVRWNDPDLAIDWPVPDIALSPRDAALPPLAEAEVFPAGSA